MDTTAKEETEKIFEAEAEGRYPVETHQTPSASPYAGAKKTFMHGCRFGYTLKTEEKDKTIAELKEQLRQTNEAVGKLTDKILNLEI